MTQIPDWSEQVGAGWRPLLDELHENLLEIYPEYEVGDLKEKFGGLRVYIDVAQSEAHALVAHYEARSRVTCEACGQPGELRSLGAWLVTLCDEHFAIRQQERAEFAAKRQGSS